MGKRIASPMLAAVLAGMLTATAVPALAQDESGEVIVTGMRRLDRDSDSDAVRVREVVAATPAPAQMLRRTADFGVQQVIITSDTREEDKRRDEVYGMTRKALDLARANSVELATGDLVVEPLTLTNYRKLIVSDNDDDGGEMVRFLVKTPLAGGVDAKTALDRIARFVKAVPAVGRAQMKPYTELTLSVVNPEQYRGAIIDLVAKDTAATSGKFGAGYGVEVGGLDRPVQWKRASLTEVHLYLPSESRVRPRN